MKVSILLVTHGRLGRYLLDTITDMIGEPPLAVEVLEVRRVQDPDALVRQGQRVVERIDDGAGVLILTDAYGSTPANIANRLVEAGDCRVVSGLNLPMLIRVCNYPDLNLNAMATAAVEGGRRGIMLCED